MGDYLWERDANPIYYIKVSKWQEYQGTEIELNKAHKSFKIDRESRAMLEPRMGVFDTV